jgi:hypothetical protein
VIKLKEIEQELENKQLKSKMIALTIVAFLLIGIVGIVAIALSIPTGEAQEGPHLIVEDIFFVAGSQTGQTSGSITITVSAFITNKGDKDAQGVEIVAFVVEKNSNLAMDKAESTLGAIGRDQTGTSEFQVQIPIDESYVVRLIIFEGGKIVVRGSGTLTSLDSPERSGTRYETEYDKYDEAGMEAMEADSFSLLGLLFVLGFVMVIIIVAILKSISSTKAQSDIEVVHVNGNNIEGLDYSQIGGAGKTNEVDYGLMNESNRVI